MRILLCELIFGISVAHLFVHHTIRCHPVLSKPLFPSLLIVLAASLFHRWIPAPIWPPHRHLRIQLQALNFGHQLLVIDALDSSALRFERLVSLLHELVVQFIINLWIQRVPHVWHLRFQKMVDVHHTVLILRPTSHHVVLYLLNRVHQRLFLLILIFAFHVLPVRVPHPPLEHAGLPPLLLSLCLLLRCQRRSDSSLLVHLLHVTPLGQRYLRWWLLLIRVPRRRDHLPDGRRRGS
mmetsp:Transcript_42498/g.112020  ORF Transcript_42498/g.112020 Transcript_42498/m.112020 type:complete len:237 (-) Transcript_42498:140-850(-)